MARYDYHSSSAGPIDTSGIKNLGAIAQNAMDLVLQQQQDDQKMNLMRQEAATQARQRQQQLDQQQAADQHQMAVERQSRVMQLAQLAKNGKAFESMAKYLMPDIDPTELQFGMTFADESSRALKEQQDKADKEKQEQINRQVLMQGGGLPALAATDPNARIPGPVSLGMPPQGELTGLGVRPAPLPPTMVSPVESAAELAGVNPDVLNTVVSGERTRQEQKRAEKEAQWQRDNAAKNARAATRAIGGGAGAIETSRRDITASRISRDYRLETSAIRDNVGQAVGAIDALNRAQASGSSEEQRIADGNMIRAYAIMVNPDRRLSDQDVAGVAGNLPGVLFGPQTADRVARGGLYTPKERAFITKGIEKRLELSRKRIEGSRRRAEIRAKKAGFEPADILDPEPAYPSAVTSTDDLDEEASKIR